MIPYRLHMTLFFFVIVSMTVFSFLAQAQTDEGLIRATDSASSSARVEPTPLQSSSEVIDQGSAVPTATPSATGVTTPVSTPPASISPRSVPSSSPILPSSSPNIPTPTNEISILPVAPINTPTSGVSGLLTGEIISFVVLGVGMLGLKLKNKNKKTKEKEEQRCDNIKTLIDRKKKELEEMIRNWPEEKIKEMAKDKIIEGLKKDEHVKKVLDAAENAKDAYDKIQKTIEILQKRYDLCMLSFPEKETKLYQGTIIENSLSDKTILENVKITKSYKVKDWSLNDVLVNKKQIEKLGEYLNDDPWYMHFWQSGNDDVIVVFKDKIFRIKYSNKTTWREAVEYGKSRGIPEEQLDFATRGKD